MDEKAADQTRQLAGGGERGGGDGDGGEESSARAGMVSRLPDLSSFLSSPTQLSQSAWSGLWGATGSVTGVTADASSRSFFPLRTKMTESSTSSSVTLDRTRAVVESLPTLASVPNLRFTDVTKFNQPRTSSVEGPGSVVALSASYFAYAAPSNDGKIRVIHQQSAGRTLLRNNSQSPVRSLLFLPGPSDLLAVLSANGEVDVFELSLPGDATTSTGVDAKKLMGQLVAYFAPSPFLPTIKILLSQNAPAALVGIDVDCNIRMWTVDEDPVSPEEVEAATEEGQNLVFASPDELPELCGGQPVPDVWRRGQVGAAAKFGHRLPATSTISAASLSSDGTLLALAWGSRAGVLALEDFALLEPQLSGREDCEITDVAVKRFSRLTGLLLIYCAGIATIELWNCFSGELLQSIEFGKQIGPFRLVLEPSGSFLFMLSRDTNVMCAASLRVETAAKDGDDSLPRLTELLSCSLSTTADSVALCAFAPQSDNRQETEILCMHARGVQLHHFPHAAFAIRGADGLGRSALFGAVGERRRDGVDVPGAVSSPSESNKQIGSVVTESSGAGHEGVSAASGSTDDAVAAGQTGLVAMQSLRSGAQPAESTETPRRPVGGDEETRPGDSDGAHETPGVAVGMAIVSERATSVVEDTAAAVPSAVVPDDSSALEGARSSVKVDAGNDDATASEMRVDVLNGMEGESGEATAVGSLAPGMANEGDAMIDDVEEDQPSDKENVDPGAAGGKARQDLLETFEQFDGAGRGVMLPDVFGSLLKVVAGDENLVGYLGGERARRAEHRAANDEGLIDFRKFVAYLFEPESVGDGDRQEVVVDASLAAAVERALLLRDGSGRHEGSEPEPASTSASGRVKKRNGRRAVGKKGKTEEPLSGSGSELMAALGVRLAGAAPDAGKDLDEPVSAGAVSGEAAIETGRVVKILRASKHTAPVEEGVAGSPGSRSLNVKIPPPADALSPDAALALISQRRSFPTPSVNSSTGESESRPGEVVDAKDLKALHNAIVRLDKSIHQQHQRMIDTLAQQIDKRLREMQAWIVKKVLSNMEQTVTKAVEASMRSSVSQNLLPQWSRLFASAMAELAAEIPKRVNVGLTESFRASFEGSIVPAYERAMQEMLRQLSDVVDQGMKEHSASVLEGQGSVLETFREASQGLFVSMAQSHQQLLESELASLSEQLQEGMSRYMQQTLFPSLQRHVDGLVPDTAGNDSLPELERLVDEGRFEHAFLQARDLSTLFSVCSLVQSTELFSKVPVPLSQATLLDMIVLLTSGDFGRRAALRATWLRETLLCLNPLDPSIATRAPSELGGVLEVLERAFSTFAGDAANSVTADLKVAMHIVNSLLK